MTLYMRWVPAENEVKPTGRRKAGAIGVVRQTDSYGQHLVDFNREVGSDGDVYRNRYWCRPQDLELVKERDYLIQQAMEALGAKTNEET